MTDPPSPSPSPLPGRNGCLTGRNGSRFPFPFLTSDQIDQWKASNRNRHLDHVLPLNQNPNGHDAVKSQGNEDHTIYPGRDRVAHEDPDPFGSSNVGSPERKNLGIQESTDEVRSQ